MTDTSGIYWKIGAGIACLLIGFIGGCSYKQGQLDKLKADYADQLDKALQENRQVEKKMQDEANAITQKYQKEQKDAEQKISDLKSRIASGSLRLSVPTAGTSTMSAGSGAAYGEGRAYLVDGRTANRLVAIIERGDKAIRKLNTCIDRYNAVRNTTDGESE